MSAETEIDGVNDYARFVETVKAFEILKIFHEKQQDVFRILAGILILGNIAFENTDKSAITVNFNVKTFLNNFYVLG